MPIVSIIVPVYNVERYLRTCLDSIVAQTFTDFEALLVDDGSTDESGRICDEYAAKDNRFVIIHKQNKGVVQARITAFEHSKGGLITFIDADDYVSPDYIEKLSKPIIEEGADMVSCDYYNVINDRIDEPKAKISGCFEQKQITEFITNHFFYDDNLKDYGMTIFLCGKMIKRQYVYESLKITQKLWYAEDQVAVFHMMQHINKLVLIPNRLYYYVRHEGQAMQIYKASLWDNLILVMEKNMELDYNNIAEKGRRKRTWCHIDYTIFIKMSKGRLSRKTFSDHLKKVRSHPYIKEFFKPIYIDFNFKENIKYWLLKLKFFNVFYFIALRNWQKNQNL